MSPGRKGHSAGTPEETLLYIIEAEEGPVVLVIGGIHGNEPPDPGLPRL